MKIILCTGDSHTWGQGADGVEESFNPPVVAGDLRLVSFHFGGYVTLLRRLVNSRTGASCKELDTGFLVKNNGLRANGGCAEIADAPLRLSVEAQLVRIQFEAQTQPSIVSIRLDGKRERIINLQQESSRSSYKTIAFFCENGVQHELTLKSEIGRVLVYRIECYQGAYAVINSGIGSCPTERFMAEYWDDYVVAYHPSFVIMEPHTINDWLTGAPAEVYLQRVRKMISSFKAMNTAPILLTVSPVMGAQSQPYGAADYTAYIKASIAAAKECNIPIADSHAVMIEKLNGLTAEQQYSLLFHDNWHVNDLGHQIYAQTAFDALLQNHML